jgi:hypothetical protein
MAPASSEARLVVTDVEETANIKAPQISLGAMQWFEPDPEQSLGRIMRRLPPLMLLPHQIEALQSFWRTWSR